MRMPSLRYSLDEWEGFMRDVNPAVLLLSNCIQALKVSCRRVPHDIGERGLAFADVVFTRMSLFGGKAFKFDMRIEQGGAKGVSIASYFLASSLLS